MTKHTASARHFRQNTFPAGGAVQAFAAGLFFATTLMTGVVYATGNDTARRMADQGVRTTEITQSTHPFETLYCARQPVRVRFIGNLVELVLNGETRTLHQAMSASGARYVVPGDETTVFWNKGPFATVTWSGQELPLCAPQGSIIPPFRALGNEPFWAVTYDGHVATLKRPGQPDQSLENPVVQASAQGQALQAGQGASAWQLQVTNHVCIDTMTGMPYPQKATLLRESVALHGCGGNPERLLQGVTWRITHVGNAPVATGAVAEIQFLANNMIAGTTGCNRFFGQYALTGEGLSFKGMGGTRMACAPELMAQEEALFKLLASVNRFAFRSDDLETLQLYAGDAQILATVSTVLQVNKK